eukprot:UN17182
MKQKSSLYDEQIQADLLVNLKRTKQDRLLTSTIMKESGLSKQQGLIVTGVDGGGSIIFRKSNPEDNLRSVLESYT